MDRYSFIAVDLHQLFFAGLPAPPIRIFCPVLHHRLIGQVKSMLNIGQFDHQPGEFGKPVEQMVEAAGRLVEAVPFDQPCQAKELMALIETAAVEITRARPRRVGSYGKTPGLSW